MLNRLLSSLPYLLIFLVFFLPAIDTDLGWHLRYGNYFLETGKILRENSLTYFLPEYQWNHSYSLYQIATSILYKIGGLSALAIGYGLLGSLMFWLFSKIVKGSFVIQLFSFLVVIFLGWNVFYLGWRAQIFTVLFILIELWLLKKSEKYPRWQYLLPVLFVLWANTHGGFVLGLLILIAHIIYQGVVSVPSLRWNLICTSGAMVVICAIATLLNPFGIGIWQETIKHSQYPLHTLIAEWLKPTFVLTTSATLTTIVLLTFLWIQKSKEKILYSLLLVLGLVLVFEARRNTPIFALFTSLSLLGIFKDQLRVFEMKVVLKQLGILTIASAIVLLFLIRIPKTMDISTNWESYCTKGLVKLPCSSISWLRTAQRSETNVFTAYEWGGILSWQLPQYKYFVDGRMPAWPTPNGKSPYTEYLEIIQAQPQWDTKLEEYKTDWLLIGAGTFLDLELKGNNKVRWREVYRDEISVVYTKI